MYLHKKKMDAQSENWPPISVTIVTVKWSILSNFKLGVWFSEGLLHVPQPSNASDHHITVIIIQGLLHKCHMENKSCWPWFLCTIQYKVDSFLHGVLQLGMWWFGCIYKNTGCTYVGCCWGLGGVQINTQGPCHCFSNWPRWLLPRPTLQSD